MATVLSFPHISTKLSVPALREGLVARPSLSRRLGRCLQSRLLLVSAPAGSGKTTLLGQWAQQGAHPVAWVSLDAGDSDPVHFWSYVVTALDGLAPGTGEHLLPMIHSARPELGDYLVAMLINLVSRVPDPFVLILDDYHLIEAESIHTGLVRLVDHLPPNMHLILSSRTDPPLPLARWRAQGHLLELRAPDLRFSLDEAEALFNRSLGVGLEGERIAAFQEWTEGWPAGLQLAGLTIAQRQAQQMRIPSAGLHEDGRYVTEYLASEVLQRQPEPLRAFLLQTSILDTLSAPLCDAVTGQAGGREVLEELYRRNLFVTALDRRGHYRYHHLFADFLRQESQQDPACDLSTLHMRAAAWYEAQGRPDEAVGHALAAGQVAEASRILKGTVRQCLMRGESSTIRRWFAGLPDEAIRGEPLFCLAYAWVLVNAGQVQTALPYLDHLEATVGEGDEARLLLGEAAAVRARAAVMAGDTYANVRASERALALLPASELLLRSEVFLDLAFAHRDNWRFAEAEEAFLEAIRLGRATGNLRAAMVAAYYLGDTYLWLGRPHDAARLYQDALDWCRRHEPPLALACWAHAGLGALLYEWDDLAEAAPNLRQAIAMARQCGEVKILIYAHITLAHLLQTQGRQDEAEAALAAAAHAAGQARIASMSSLLDLARIRLWIRQGQVNEASAWLQRHGLSIKYEALTSDELTMLAWCGLAQSLNSPAPAEGLARILERVQVRSEAEAEAGMAQPHAADLTLLALAHLALARREQATRVMSQAVAVAEPAGLVRSFADLDCLGAGALLRQVAARQPASGYLRKLLATLTEGRPAEAATITPPAPAEEPAVELNAREVEVLQHVAQGRSNQEIADEMILALSTVKWYLRTIYSKLDVNRRTQAVARARALGLLAPR